MTTSTNTIAGTVRFRVYRSAESVNDLCVVSARDGRHALQIARRHFDMSRTAHARRETPADIARFQQFHPYK